MYTAKKPVKLGNRMYQIGDEIPEREIQPIRAKALLQYGHIQIAPETPLTASPMASGTETHTETTEGAKAVKQPLNGTKKPAAKKQPVKKGGK